MKITPLEIRQKSFEKKLRGYDKDEVNGFLQSLSQEWEQVQEEVKELRLRNDAAEKEIKQLREVENSLFKTLKTAEDTGANMIDQATKTAELHMRETQMNADALLNEAKTKARTLIDDADARARGILEKMDQDLQTLKMEYRSLENLRDIIITELRNLSNDTLSRVDKIETKASQDAAAVKERMKETAAEIAEQTEALQKNIEETKPPAIPEPQATAAPVAEPEPGKEPAEAKAEIDWTEPVDDSSAEETVTEDNQESDDNTDSWSEAPKEETEPQPDSPVESEDDDSSFFDQIK